MLVTVDQTDSLPHLAVGHAGRLVTELIRQLLKWRHKSVTRNRRVFTMWRLPATGSDTRVTRFFCRSLTWCLVEFRNLTVKQSRCFMADFLSLCYSWSSVYVSVLHHILPPAFQWKQQQTVCATLRICNFTTWPVKNDAAAVITHRENLWWHKSSHI